MNRSTQILLDAVKGIYSDSGPAMSLRATAGNALEAYEKAAALEALPNFSKGSRGDLILNVVLPSSDRFRDARHKEEAAELARSLTRAIDLFERREIAALGSPFMALTSLIQYAEWTISVESPGYHPTMPSAVAAAKGALRSLSRGLNGQDLDAPDSLPLVSMPLMSEGGALGEDEIAERKAVGTAMVRALLAAGFSKDELRVNPALINAELVGNPLSEDEVLLNKLLTVEQEVFGLKAGDCPEPFADYDRAGELNRMLTFCTTAIRNRIQAGYGRVPDGGEAPAKPVVEEDVLSIITDLLSLWRRARSDWGQPEDLTEIETYGIARAYIDDNKPIKEQEVRDLLKAMSEAIDDEIVSAGWKTCCALTHEGQRAEAWVLNHPE